MRRACLGVRTSTLPQVNRRSRRFNTRLHSVFIRLTCHRSINPGFFDGLSGIGYVLLRLGAPGVLPSILAFD